MFRRDVLKLGLAFPLLGKLPTPLEKPTVPFGGFPIARFNDGVLANTDEICGEWGLEETYISYPESGPNVVWEKDLGDAYEKVRIYNGDEYKTVIQLKEPVEFIKRIRSGWCWVPRKVTQALLSSIQPQHGPNVETMVFH